MRHVILGDYKILKALGEGSLGAVYLAEHRFMKRHYALKVLASDLSSDRGFVQRFEEEVGALASLEHPHIVKIHNVSCADGRYFLVSDCISDSQGQTTNLAQYLRGVGRHLNEEEIFRLLWQVADALDFAHGKKIGERSFVHWGLKPNNVLLGKEGDEYTAYLSDFGLSRVLGMGAVLHRTYQGVAEAIEQVGNGIEAPLTSTMQHASFVQNYALLAPEYKRLETTFLPHAKADAYAFGVLAYFLLMGEFPEGIFEMPSSREREKYHWDELIVNCLQSRPEKRPDHLLSQLEDIAKRTRSRPTVILSQSLGAEEGMRSLRPILQVPQLERPQTDPDPGAIFKVSTAVKTYNPEQRRDISNLQPLLTDMVIIPGGMVYRGSHDGNRDEMPRHQVMLSSFAIDIHPVTNEQFVRFLEVMGGEKDSNHNDIIRLRDSRIKRSGGKLNIESGYAKHPVVGVTWYGAVAYAKWVGKRLPTEAEWEVAARGGHENGLFPTGDDIEKNQANFFSSDTIAVMSYIPNDYGLYDMAGNVYEWCQDWYGYNYYEVSAQEPDNPHGPLQGVYRVLRGGCWKSLKEDLRCSRRHRNNPGTVNGTYGFRCAAGVDHR